MSFSSHLQSYYSFAVLTLFFCVLFLIIANDLSLITYQHFWNLCDFLNPLFKLASNCKVIWIQREEKPVWIHLRPPKHWSWRDWALERVPHEGRGPSVLDEGGTGRVWQWILDFFPQAWVIPSSPTSWDGTDTIPLQRKLSRLPTRPGPSKISFVGAVWEDILVPNWNLILHCVMPLLVAAYEVRWLECFTRALNAQTNNESPWHHPASSLPGRTLAVVVTDSLNQWSLLGLEILPFFFSGINQTLSDLWDSASLSGLVHVFTVLEDPSTCCASWVARLNFSSCAYPVCPGTCGLEGQLHAHWLLDRLRDDHPAIHLPLH